jgi:hypothetical protein
VTIAGRHDASERPHYWLCAFASRAILTAAAICVCVWGVVVYPVFWSSAALDAVSAKIAAGEPFKRDALLALRPAMESLSDRSRVPPESLRSIALIELRLAEIDLLDGKRIGKDPQFQRARDAIVKSLQAAPSDGFLWFSLFWLLKTRDGFSNGQLDYLRMSYLTAPHEGWIAVRRNATVLPLFPSLPDDLRADVLTEFRSLVDTQPYISQSASILTGPGWPYRDKLISELENASDEAKQKLDDAVYNLGFDIVIPGVRPHGLRPWH